MLVHCLGFSSWNGLLQGREGLVNMFTVCNRHLHFFLSFDFGFARQLRRRLRFRGLARNVDDMTRTLDLHTCNKACALYRFLLEASSGGGRGLFNIKHIYSRVFK